VKLRRREKILAAVAGALMVLLMFRVALVLGRASVGASGRSLAELRAVRDKKQEELARHRRAVEQAEQAALKLAEWQRRSLPSDPTAARAQYQDWLRELVEQIEFQQRDVFSGEPQSRQGIYTVFPFRIQGRASLEQVVRFLYEFYQAGHLHKVRRLALHPVEGSSLLDVSISIEALALPKSDRRQSLCTERSDRLKHDDVAEYLELRGSRRIVSRLSAASAASATTPAAFTPTASAQSAASTAAFRPLQVHQGQRHPGSGRQTPGVVAGANHRPVSGTRRRR